MSAAISSSPITSFNTAAAAYTAPTAADIHSRLNTYRHRHHHHQRRERLHFRTPPSLSWAAAAQADGDGEYSSGTHSPEHQHRHTGQGHGYTAVPYHPDHRRRWLGRCRQLRPRRSHRRRPGARDLQTGRLDLHQQPDLGDRHQLHPTYPTGNYFPQTNNGSEDAAFIQDPAGELNGLLSTSAGYNHAIGTCDTTTTPTSASIRPT